MIIGISHIVNTTIKKKYKRKAHLYYFLVCIFQGLVLEVGLCKRAKKLGRLCHDQLFGRHDYFRFLHCYNVPKFYSIIINKYGG